MKDALTRPPQAPLPGDALARLRRQLAYRLAVLGTTVYAAMTALAWVPSLRAGHVELLMLDLLVLAWGVTLLLVRRPPLAPSAATILPPLVLVVAFFFATLGPGDMRPALAVALSVVAGALGGVRGALWVTGALAAAVVAMYAVVPADYGPWRAALTQPLGSQATSVAKVFLLAGAMGGVVASLMARMAAQVRASGEVNEYYKLLAEHASDVVWTGDLQLRNTYISPSIERLRGYTPDEIARQSVEERVLEPSLSAARALLRERMALIAAGDSRGWEPAMFDLWQPHKDGRTVITSNHVRLVPGPDGRPASLVGVSRDVTAIRQAERLQRLQATMASRVAESPSVPHTAEACLSALLEFAGAEQGALLIEEAEGRGAADTPPRTVAVSPELRALLGEAGPLTGDTPAQETVRRLLAAARASRHERKLTWDSAKAQLQDAEGLWSIRALPLGLGQEAPGHVLLASRTLSTFLTPPASGFEELLLQAGRHMTHSLARAALDASERRYRALTENSSDVIMRLSPEGRYLYANPAVQQIAGVPHTHFVGKTLATAGLPAPLGQRFQGLLDRVIDSNRPAGITYYIPTTDRWVDMQVVPERDAHGEVVSVITTSRDITSLKETERALQASELRYRTLFEAANDGILLLTPPEEGGRFVAANKRAAELLGLPVEELLGRTPAELSPAVQPDGRPSRDLAAEKIRRALEGVAQVFEWRHQPPAGGPTAQTVDVEVSLHRVDLPDGVRIQTTWRDLTAFKRAERALKREARFRAILGDIANDFIRLPVAAFDDGIRRALAAIGGALGATCAVLLGEGSAPGELERRQRWLTEGAGSCGGCSALDGGALEPATFERLARLETVVVRTTAPPTPGTVVLEPLASQGRCLGALGFHFASPDRRLTEPEGRLVMLTAATLATTLERQRTEEERQRLDAQLRQTQKLEAVGLLAGGVAHDFNNILCAIGGTAELLTDDAERGMLHGESVRAMARDISQATERAASLTRQLLSFARQADARAEDVPVARALSAVHKILIRLLGEGIALEMDIAEEVGAVHMPPGQLDQILVNLAVNARDAMPEGGRLEISARPTEVEAGRPPGLQPGPYVLLSIRDTGHGMPAAVRRRAFDPFFTTKEVGKGTGLGLSTVHGICRQARGHVEVHSEPGAGATFLIYLPRVTLPSRRAPPAPLPAPLPAAPGAADAERATILVVEDAPDVRARTAALLRRLGYQVIQAQSPQQALRTLDDGGRGGTVDLLMTDVIMPQMNGRELAAAARVQRAQLPVLFTSGYTRNILDSAEELGASVHFLPKPYNLASLAKAVEAALGAPGDGRGRAAD